MNALQRRVHARLWLVLIVVLAGALGVALVDRPHTPVVAQP